MSKLKMWKGNSDWEESESEWDEGAKKAAEKQPIKQLNKIPSMVGITKDTARFLKWKSLKWMFKEDHDGTIRKELFSNPFKYVWGYMKSIFQEKSYRREGDYFLYGIKGLDEFEHLLEDQTNLFVIGFSYCHKPFECPSGRFTDECIHDPENPVCRQCFIGKAVNALPEKNVVPLFIPTIHYIAGSIIRLMNRYPEKEIIFLITACEMTLEMFGDWGNMSGIKGVGVRLDGRICNTMRAFALSEKGVKPGLTVVMPETQQKILDLIRYRRERFV